MGEITLESLCGEHLLPGVEMTKEETENMYSEKVISDALLFTLDGITYMMVENPSDGYRSYCEEIKVSNRKPRFSFPPVKVLCSMMEKHGFWE